MKQTAVEYLFEQLWETPKDKLTWNTILSKAKEMEKEQMLKTFAESRVISVECAVWNCEGDRKKWESFEQYYNETYGK